MNNFSIICTHIDAKRYCTSKKDNLIRCLSGYKKFNRSSTKSKETTRKSNKRSNYLLKCKNKLTNYLSPSFRLAHLKGRAHARKRTFDINIEQFKILISQPCHWCKVPDSNELRLGLDRINNELGYSIDNVVPSCGPCNNTRSNKITFEEFPIIIKALLLFRETGAKPEPFYFDLYIPDSKSRNRRSSGYTKLLLQARKKEVNLTKEEYFVFIKYKSCYYCKSVLPISGHGLDRISNNLPYSLSNILPACPICNDIRKDNLTVEETEVIIWTLCKLRGQQ